MSCTWRIEEMLVLRSLRERKGHYKMRGTCGSALVKGRAEWGCHRWRNLIFKVLQNSTLPLCTYLDSPSSLSPQLWAFLPLTGSEGRHFSFLRAASNQSKYKLLSSLHTSPAEVLRRNPRLIFRTDLKSFSVANAWTANYICLPLPGAKSNRVGMSPNTVLFKTWAHLKLQLPRPACSGMFFGEGKTESPDNWGNAFLLLTFHHWPLN